MSKASIQSTRTLSHALAPLLLGMVLTVAVAVLQLFSYRTALTETVDVMTLTSRMAQFSSRIQYLNEIQTMSARQYALTGQEHWRERYFAHASLLADSIAGAKGLGTREETERLELNSEAPNNELVAMEERSFELVAKGHSTAAQAILLSDMYGKWKRLSSAGQEGFVRSVSNRLAQQERDTTENTSNLELLSVFQFSAIFFVWLLALREVLRCVRLEKDLRQRERDSRHVIDAIESISDGIVIGAPDGTIQFANQSFCDLNGLLKSQVLGENTRTLWGRGAPQGDYQDLWGEHASDRPWCSQLSLKALGSTSGVGESYWADLSISPIRGEHGEFEGIVAAQRNITEQVRERARDRLLKQQADVRAEVASILQEPKPLDDRIVRALDAMFRVDDFCRERGAALVGEFLGGFGEKQTLGTALFKPSTLLELADDLERVDQSWELQVTSSKQPDGSESGYYLVPFGGMAMRGTLIISSNRAPRMNAWRLEMLTATTRLLGDAITSETLSNKLREALGDAESANAAKSRFLTNMSHEIRTPMTSIIGYADLLLDKNNAPEDPEVCVETILSSSKHLLTIINDILDLSKVEAGKLSAERIATSPWKVAQDVSDLMTERAQAKGLDLSLRFDGGLPKKMLTDPTRLRQIILNLVGNAIKFTEAGHIHITMRCDDGVDGQALFVEVVDTGIGMTEEQQLGIFQEFQQADISTTRRFGGTGIGLALSRRLAWIIGGDLSCRSEEGSGSRFVLEIPKQAGEVWSLQRPVNPVSTQREISKVVRRIPFRLLLAEDTAINRRLVARILANSGAEVETVADGIEAVTAVREAARGHNQFDAILMDIMMPNLDGLGATEQLRKEGFDLPIIALTADAMDGSRKRCLAGGCDGYATKPIDQTALFAELHRCIERHRVGSRDPHAA
ncbi:MAG: PAS domain S-box-containing protein [Planctomycetota bacterium]|jgi:PAS domain S-box-containing protein